MEFVVYRVEFGGDVDGTGPERWRGCEVARFGTEQEAEAFADTMNDYCEIDVE